MIGDTLYACLTGEPRRSHELYDSDKLSLLYRLVLEDEAKGDSIHRLIFELNEKAKERISEEEKKKRRKTQAQYDADALKDTTSREDGFEEPMMNNPAETLQSAQIGNPAAAQMQ